MDIRQLITKMSPKGWAMVGGSVAAAIVFLMLVMNFASQPSYTTIETGLDPAQTGKITSALDAKGITYQIGNGGTSLAVNSGQVSTARITLATAGLLGIGSQQPGFELLNSSQLGASNFQQQVTYQRALEGQLDQTIEQIQGVDSATVNLVLPNQQDQLFGDSGPASSASVLLSDSGTIDPAAIKGIAELVASSVQGLSDSKVTITDSSGALLWPSSAAAGAGTGGGLPAAQSANEQYDSTMTSQVDAMLAQTLGPGKAQVVVNGNLNSNQSTQQQLTYGTKGVPLTAQTQTETLKGGNTSGGTTGTIPAYAGATTGTGSNYSNKTSSTTYGVDKTITNSTIAPGAINNQTVSVLVDKSVPAAELTAIRNAVAGAVGLNPKRGDTLSVSQISFTKTPAATTSTAGASSKMMGYAKYAVIGIGALLFLFFMRRNLKRRERETFEGQPTWLRELATPRPLAALGSGGDEPATEVKRLRSPVNVPKRQVEELVERDPDRVAQQVRAWMSED
jgi:flagellar M-ring protein FliF